MKSKLFFMVLGLILATFCYASAQVPQYINYQGKLTNATGAPVTDTIKMVFSIYADTITQTSLWSETNTAVVVEKGIFNVLLGSISPIGYSVFDGSTRYLGVKVGDDDAEISPRKPMVSVAYALRAGSGGGDNDWTFHISDDNDTTLMTGGSWGIARYGNTFFGTYDSTHVNLGVASTTGDPFNEDQKYCTVGGGFMNTASLHGATVAGGDHNNAFGTGAAIGGGSYNYAYLWPYGTIGGGYYNLAEALYATVGGGRYNRSYGGSATIAGGDSNIASQGSVTIGGGVHNTASGLGATIGGGKFNNVSGNFATIPGGDSDTAAGDYSITAGRQVGLTSDADYTFAFGNHFSSSASHAVIFHDTDTPIKVGIGKTDPTQTLDVAGTAQVLGFKMPTDANSGYVLTSNASGVGTWQPVIGGSDNDWTISGNNMYSGVSGNVGIGTTSPTYKLDVSGNIRATGTIYGTVDNADKVDGYHAGNLSGQVAVSNNTLCSTLNADKVDSLHASLTPTANYLYPLDASTKIPNARLYTGSGNGLDADKVDGKHGTNLVRGVGTTNYIPKWVGSDTLGNSAIYDTAGRVGIGTKNPGAKLEVDTTTGTAIIGKVDGGSGIKYGGIFEATENGSHNIGVYAWGGCFGFGCTPASQANVGIWATDAIVGTHPMPSGNWAGYFSGDVRINGDLELKGSVKFEYDSTFSMSVGETKTLTHNLGGDSTKYIVTMYGISSTGGVHQANYGTNCYQVLQLNKWIGCEWDQLTSTTIHVTRAANDDLTVASKQWNKVILRILKNQ